MARGTQSFQDKWTQFTSQDTTIDSLRRERRGFGRCLLLPHIAFLIPVEDEAVLRQLQTWQQALQPWLQYDPQPTERLHITLHYVGLLRRNPWMLLPNSWRRSALDDLAERVRPVVEQFSPFTIQIGPLNSFRNAPFAEVHDPNQCLRLLRARVQRALPRRARPPSEWRYMPHITLGYWGKQPASPLIQALEPYRNAAPVSLDVERVKFTIYERDVIPFERDFLSDAREKVIANLKLLG